MMRALMTTTGIAAALVAAILSASVAWPLQAAEQASKSHVVDIRAFKFHPNKLDVSPGDRIVWTNRDLVPHTVTADDKGWDSKTIAKGAKWETVVKAGMGEMRISGNRTCRLYRRCD